jgi:hypothetical protein
VAAGEVAGGLAAEVLVVPVPVEEAAGVVQGAAQERDVDGFRDEGAAEVVGQRLVLGENVASWRGAGPGDVELVLAGVAREDGPESRPADLVQLDEDDISFAICLGRC